MTYLLDAAVAATPLGDGRHALEMNAEWNTPNQTPNGGYVLAVMAAAALRESDRPDLLSISISYLKPARTGPAEVAVTPLRAGRRIATHEVRLVQAGQLVAHAVVATHDWDAAGAAHHEPHAAPDVPSPDDCHDLMSQVPKGAIPIIEKYAYRHPEVPGWTTGQPSGTTEATFWIRAADERPVDALLAAAMVDAYPPVTTEIGQIASATVQLTVHLRRRPTGSVWALARIVSRHVIDGYHDEDAELWDDRGRLIAQSRQLAVLG